MKNKAKTPAPAQRYEIRSATIDGVTLLRKESGKIELHVPTRLQQGDLAGWRKRNAQAIADAKRSFNEPRVFEIETEQAPARKRTKLTSLTIEPSPSDREYGITWSIEVDVYNEASVGELGEPVYNVTFETSKRDIKLAEFADGLTEDQSDFIDQLKKRLEKQNRATLSKATAPRVIRNKNGTTIIEMSEGEGAIS